MRYSIGRFDGEELFIVVNDTVLNISYNTVTTPYCVQLYTCRYFYDQIKDNNSIKEIIKKECNHYYTQYDITNCIYVRSIFEMRKYIYMTFIYDMISRKYLNNTHINEYVWDSLNEPIREALQNTYNLLKQRHEDNYPNIYEGLDYNTRLSLHPYENGTYN